MDPVRRVVATTAYVPRCGVCALSDGRAAEGSAKMAPCTVGARDAKWTPGCRRGRRAAADVRCTTHAVACGLCDATMCDACMHTGGCRLCGDAVCEACMRTCRSSREGVGCNEQACAGCFVKCGLCGADADAPETTCEAPGCGAECDYCGQHMCGACHANVRCGCPVEDGRPLYCGVTGGAGGDGCANNTCDGCGMTVCEECGPPGPCENCRRPTNLCAECADVELACGHTNVCLLCRIVCEHPSGDGNECGAAECASCWKHCSSCDATLCSTHAAECDHCRPSHSCRDNARCAGTGAELCGSCGERMCGRCVGTLAGGEKAGMHAVCVESAAKDEAERKVDVAVGLLPPQPAKKG
jgi:hypothetical protein